MPKATRVESLKTLGGDTQRIRLPGLGRAQHECIKTLTLNY